MIKEWKCVKGEMDNEVRMKEWGTNSWPANLGPQEMTLAPWETLVYDAMASSRNWNLSPLCQIQVSADTQLWLALLWTCWLSSLWADMSSFQSSKYFLKIKPQSSILSNLQISPGHWLQGIYKSGSQPVQGRPQGQAHSETHPSHTTDFHVACVNHSKGVDTLAKAAATVSWVQADSLSTQVKTVT